MRFGIDPIEIDRGVADVIADNASPLIEFPAQLLTLAGDEKFILALAGFFWLCSRKQTTEREANYVVSNVLVADILSHVLKQVFAQVRPDRRVMRSPRHGIPHSGKPFDAFPSGHAMLAGTLASSLARMFPSYRAWIWGAAGTLAATRVVLLAHWLSDVVVGLGLGVFLEHLHWNVTRRSGQLHVAHPTHQARHR